MGTRLVASFPYLFGAIFGLLTMACQGSDLLLPADGAPSRLSPVDGNNQQGTIGTKLPHPLVVEVTDLSGRPVVDVPVRFQSDAPGADVSPSVDVTDSLGRAAVRVQLGTSEGTQEVNAALEGTTSAGPSTTFRLTALAPQPDDNDDDRDEDDDKDGDSAGNGNRGGNGGDGHGKGRGHGHGQDDDDNEDEDD